MVVRDLGDVFKLLTAMEEMLGESGSGFPLAYNEITLRLLSN